jgi:Arylsulfotransferase (ASST)
VSFGRLTPALATLLAAIFAAVVSTSEGAGRPVSVYPSAGTPTASPQTQISFRGADPAELGAIKVTGSRTGFHRGRLERHSDGNGASFLPTRPFDPGELVTVRAASPLVGERHGAVTFRTAVFRPKLAAAAAGGGGSSSLGDSSFHSVGGFHPPAIKVLTRKKGRAKGDIFLAPKSGQRAAMITDDSGKLVWYHPAPHGFRIYDFRRQRYHGKQALTWMEWRSCSSSDCAVGQIYDTSYRPVASVRAGNGYAADFHEFGVTSNGTAYLIINQPVAADLRSVGGPKNGPMYDSIVQKIDIVTGLVLFEWHASGHVPLSESYLRYRHGTFDPYHVNSIYEESNGDLLISARNTSAAYEVDPSSGNIVWRLGGKKSGFKFGHGARFLAQHDVRRVKNGNITIFDNEFGAGMGHGPSRGLVLSVDMKHHSAKLVRSLHRKTSVRAASQGNVQGLPNGDYFVGWGGLSPYYSEFDRKGHLVYDAQFFNTVGNSYRAFRFPWHATPADPPAVFAAVSRGKTKVWMSWNGATDVAKWRVLAGATPVLLADTATVARRNFETAATLKSVQHYVKVQALSSNGSVLGTSPVSTVQGAG